MVSAREGAAWAFGALYRRNAKYLGGIVTRLLRSREDADDIVHDTFVIAFEKLHTLREDSAFRGWLLRIAVMQTRQVLRRRRLRALLGLDFTLEDATLEHLASREVSPEDRAELGRIDAALASADVNARIAWMLRHVDGYTLEEVAQACACSLSTAKRRVQAAQAIVQRTFQSEWSR